MQSNVSLLPYNTFHIDVQAKYFVELHSEEELQELFATEIFKQEKKLMLGGGANVLFTGDVGGLVIKISEDGARRFQKITEDGARRFQKISEDGRKLLIKVWAGEEWSDFVEYANEQGRAGVENLIAIPGKVGTAPISNIGAYGMEVGNRIAWVEGYDLETLEWKKFTHEECKFGYRTSIFKSALQNRFLVTHVVFALEKFSTGYAFNTNYADVQSILKGKQPIHLQEISEIIATIRAKKLPDLNVIGTAGSFFANPFVCMQHFEALQKEYPEMPWYPTPSPFGDSPGQGRKTEVVKLSAGRLIEKAGLKGYSNGKAGTSPHHALIVINEGGSASDVLEVVEHIQAAVKEKFGVELIPEVVYV